MRSRNRFVLGGPALILVILLLHLVDSTTETKYPTYRIQEEQPPGTLIADLASRLPDNAGVRYSIFRSVQNATDMFDLDAESGRLSIGDRLDRERVCAQMVVCLVRLDVALERSGIFSDLIKVEINVEDINDNDPEFRMPLLRKSLPESVPLGLVFEVNPAVDPDSPANGMATSYSLEGPPSSPFRLVTDRNRVTNTLRLKLELVDALDRERVDLYRLAVKAVDQGQPPRSGTLVVEIQVEDVNDNSPRFSEDTYEATVASDAPVGTSVVKVTAVDPDLGLNGQVRYSLSRKSRVLYGDIFDVNSTSGVVTTKVRLDDRRTSTSYGLVVVAKDLGEDAIPTTTNIRIQVTSSNHHPPVMTIATLGNSQSVEIPKGNSPTVEIPENGQPHLYVAGLTVTDVDFGLAGQVTCQLNASDFALVSLSDREFKVVALRSFDREVNDRFKVKVICSDLGEPSLTSEMDILVNILDADDNAPRFTQSEYNRTVVENTPRGTSLVRIHAEDADSGDNGMVEYALDSDADSSVFRIDSRSGEIFLLGSLDRESVDHFDFGAVARSGKAEVETGNATTTFRHRVTCRVHVTVSDANDEVPRFERPSYRFSVGENVNSGTEVGRVAATDRDLAPHNAFVYHLEFLPEDPVSASSFAVDPVLGVIFTRQMLDREAASHHTLRVRARPSDAVAMATGTGNTPDDVTVVFVQVDDVNDNAPVVEFPSGDDDTVHVTGNVTRGRILANLSAYDRDSGENSELRYSISAGNERGTYFLHPKTGSLIWDADGLTLRPRGDDCIDELEIVVKDGGIPLPLMTSARLYVTFDCDDVDLDRRKTSSRLDLEDRWRFSFYFITITVALVFLVLLLLVIVARVGFRANRVDTLTRRTKGGQRVVRLQGDLLGPVDGGSVDRLSGMIIGGRGQEEASSSLELDYKRENETNDQRRPGEEEEGNESDDSDAGDRDTDSGCVDVSSV